MTQEENLQATSKAMLDQTETKTPLRERTALVAKAKAHDADSANFLIDCATDRGRWSLERLPESNWSILCQELRELVNGRKP